MATGRGALDMMDYQHVLSDWFLHPVNIYYYDLLKVSGLLIWFYMIERSLEDKLPTICAAARKETVTGHRRQHTRQIREKYEEHRSKDVAAQTKDRNLTKPTQHAWIQWSHTQFQLHYDDITIPNCLLQSCSPSANSI